MSLRGLYKFGNIEVNEIEHHRNGIGGEGFYAVKFKHENRNMLGVVFDAPAHVAVFDTDLLGKGVIGFPQNTWRGDYYEYDLRDAVRMYDSIRKNQVV